jgi:xanthine dehydrogenase YagT iron-sulfur-binding subunit
MKKDPEPEDAISTGLSRRDFLGIAGAGVVGAAVAGAAAPAQAQCDPATEALPRLTLMVNGRRRSLQVEPRWTLLYVLREKLGMTGTKIGCERGECGACTVLIDGEPRYSCMTLALEAEGKAITTIEGLMHDKDLGPVQQAFVEKDGMQCGYCTPGQVMAAEGLLLHNPEPSINEIRTGMSGNLCRCGAYRKIIDSVQRAAELRKGTK